MDFLLKQVGVKIMGKFKTTISNGKKSTQLKPLPKGSVEFLKMFKDSESYKNIPPNLKGIITQSIRKKSVLNNKHLNLLNSAVKFKGISNILDVSNSRLVYKGEYKNKTESKKEKVIITKSDYPFDVHWKSPKGNTAKQNWNLYTKSAIWKAKRNYILEKRGNRCQDPECSQPIRNKSKLHCHHLTYVRFGCEEENDLQILCETCHNKAHKDKTIKEMQEQFELANWVDGINLLDSKNKWRLNSIKSFGFPVKPSWGSD